MTRSIFFLLAFLVCGLRAQTPVNPGAQPEVQATGQVDAEKKMLRDWSEQQEARRALDETISKVKDLARRKALVEALKANDEAFSKLVESEAILRYGGAIIGRDGQADVRVSRTVSAGHAHERAKTYAEWREAIAGVTE